MSQNFRREGLFRSLKNRRDFLLGATAVGLAAIRPGAVAKAAGGSSDAITLGATLPMTGPIAEVGLASLHGGMSYFNDVNAKGGVHGRKIEWIVEDDAFQPARAVAGTRKLIESDKVFALFSSSGTNSSLAVLPYVKNRKTLWLFPYAGAKQFTDPVSPIYSDYSVLRVASCIRDQVHP